jgi:hypothetical protein
MTTETKQSGSAKLGRFTKPRWLILAALLLLAVSLLGLRGYEIVSTPDIGEPFDVETFSAYRLSDEKNAFTHYRKVFELFVSEQKVLESHPSLNPQDFFVSVTTGQEDWSRAIPAVREWVALNRKSVEEWRRGAACEECLIFPLEEAATASAGDAVNVATHLTRQAEVESLEAMRLNSAGHPDEAWECYRILLRAGRHLAMHAPLMGPLVAGAIADLGVSGGVAWASQRSVNAALLRKAIRDVESIEEMRTPPSDVIKVEYLALREVEGSGMVVGSPLPEWLRYTGYPEQISRTARLVTANLLTQADRPRYLRSDVHPGKLGLFELDPTAPPDPHLRPPEQIERSAVNSALTVAKTLRSVAPETASIIEICDPQSFTQNIHVVIQVNDTAQTRRSALLLVLALQLHYREHGAFPASLEELVKNGYLKSIPIDPFGKGGPFHYRREPGPRGAAVVWSVWIDGVDQAGIDLNGGLRVLAPGTSAAPSK